MTENTEWEIPDDAKTQVGVTVTEDAETPILLGIRHKEDTITETKVRGIE